MFVLVSLTTGVCQLIKHEIRAYLGQARVKFVSAREEFMQKAKVKEQ